MKKILILITMVVFAMNVCMAQTEKGTQNLGLNTGFTYSKTDNFVINVSDNSTSTINTKASSFSIGPNYSYFIAAKLDVGVNLSYGTSTTTNTGNGNYYYPTKMSSNNYSGEIFIRKYYMCNDKIGFRVGPYIGYSTGTSNTTNLPAYAIDDYKGTTDNYFAGINLGIVYYATKKLGVSAVLANLNYQHYKFNNTTQGHESMDDVNVDFISNNLSFSIFYIIGKK